MSRNIERGRESLLSAIRLRIFSRRPPRRIAIDVRAQQDLRRHREMARHERDRSRSITAQRRFHDALMLLADIARLGAERDREPAVALALGIELAVDAQEPGAV